MSTIATPIPSSTVVLLRDTPSGMKILLLRRNSDIAYGGSWVFPGGRIDTHEFDQCGGDALQAARLAAVRETAEEAGITINDEDLVHFSHWTTPVVRPKRFSTWFFLAPVTGKDVQIDGGEIHDFKWHTIDNALSERAAGNIELPPPTFVTLNQLKPFETVADAIAHFSTRTPFHIQPNVSKTTDGFVYLYEGDAGHTTQDPTAEGPRHRLVQKHSGEWEYLLDL